MGGAAALALALTACGGATTGDGETESGAHGDLDGGGASSQQAAQNAWRAEFQQRHAGVTVTYDAVGSSDGREQFVSGDLAFAGSDAYLTDDERSSATTRCGAAPIEVPGYISPIAVIFNVDGVESLDLSPETVANIFNGTVTTWSDPVIAAENPDLDLPAAEITPIHRSDKAGITESFTRYLSTVAPDAWPYAAADTWPIRGGEGDSGTAGVVAAVNDGTNTIGYADASQAGDLGHVAIKVGETYVSPSPEAAAKVFEVSPEAAAASDVALVYDLDYETEDAGVYPVVLTSYLIACQTYADEQSAGLARSYLSYVLSEEGQLTAAENAGASPLPLPLSVRARRIVEGISVK